MSSDLHRLVAGYSQNDWKCLSLDNLFFYNRRNKFPVFIEIREEHIDTYTQNRIRRIKLLNQVPNILRVFPSYKSVKAIIWRHQPNHVSI